MQPLTVNSFAVLKRLYNKVNTPCDNKHQTAYNKGNSPQYILGEKVHHSFTRTFTISPINAL